MTADDRNVPCPADPLNGDDALDNLDMAGAHIRAAMAFTEGKLVAKDRAQTATNDLEAALRYIEKHRQRRESPPTTSQTILNTLKGTDHGE